MHRFNVFSGSTLLYRINVIFIESVFKKRDHFAIFREILATVQIGKFDNKIDIYFFRIHRQIGRAHV